MCAAHAIMMDGNEKAIHRLYAAKMLLRVIFPQAISLSMDQENPEELAIEATKVTQTLKGDPATRGIPVIALTAHAMPGDRERAIQVGCDGYLAKPCEPRAVVAEVQRFLGKNNGA